MSFVVDLSKLNNPNDVHADDLAVADLGFCDLHCRIVKEKARNAIVVNVRHQYHVHATDPDLHRMIAFLEKEKNSGG